MKVRILADRVTRLGARVIDVSTGYAYTLVTNDPDEEAQWADDKGDRFTLFGVTVEVQ